MSISSIAASATGLSGLVSNLAGVPSLLSSGGGSSKITFTFISENSGEPVWKSAKVIECTIVSPTENTDYPFDMQGSGTTVQQYDFPAIKIIQPVRFRVVLVTNMLSVLESLITSWQDNTQTFKITAKGFVAQSMSLVNLELDLDGSMIDHTKVVMEFEQVILGFPSDFSPANPADQSTYGLGAITPPASTSTVSQITSGLRSRLGI
jgi:hypothetical protein